MDTATTGRSLASILGAFALALTPPSNAEETVYYVHVDALGSPILETDQAGNVVRQLDYRAYGEEVLDSPKDGPAFTGHYRDAATGLVYMQQRYYDPAAGRFLSVDPIAARPSGDNFNRYAYANNNPYRYIDPEGEDPVEFTRGMIVGFGNEMAFGTLHDGYGEDGSAEKAGFEAGQKFGTIVDRLSARGLAKPAGKLAVKSGKDKGKSKGKAASRNEHTKNSRPSTESKHQEGQARQQRDRGGEKADVERKPPRKRPPDHKGPWPPKRMINRPP